MDKLLFLSIYNNEVPYEHKRNN